MKSIVFILLSLIFTFELSFNENIIEVLHESESLKHPFSGGLNKPRIQWIDWDNDNDDDLFILDEDGYIRYMENVSVGSDFKFIIRKTNMFNIFAGGWFFIADFDGDQDLDIITQSQIDLQQASYYTNNNGQMEYIDNLDVVSDPVMTPTFADIDNDGDLDFFTGNYIGTVNFYENIGFSNNVPQYTYITNFWQEISIIGPSARHGASALTFIDLDGDSDLDLSWGDYFQQSMYIIWNIGDVYNPLMNIDNVTQQFPQNDPIITSGQNMPSFSDIDGDGDLDLFASVLSGAYGNQWVNNFIYYENIGSSTSPSYEYRTNDFLNGIDVLLNSSPELYDIDQDGDEDLFIATMVDPSVNPWTGRIHFYRNTGSINNPIFELETTEFLGTDLGTDLSIVFGDLNGDLNADALVGNANGFLKVFINSGDEEFMYQGDAENIDLSGSSTPELGHIGPDGELVLLLGENNGNLNCYAVEIYEIGQVGFNHLFDNLIPTIYTYTDPELLDLDGDLDLDLLVGTGFDGIKVYYNSSFYGPYGFEFYFEEDENTNIDSYGNYVNITTESLYNENTSAIVGTSTGGLYSLTLALCSKGDLNDDAVLDILDVVLIVNIVMEELELSCKSDINSDGIVDILDIVSLVSIIMNR